MQSSTASSPSPRQLPLNSASKHSRLALRLSQLQSQRSTYVIPSIPDLQGPKLTTHQYNLGRKEPFELVFISLVVIIVARSTTSISQRVANPTIKKELRSLLLGSGRKKSSPQSTLTPQKPSLKQNTALFLFAIVIQKLDFVYCAQLTAFRARIGWPLGFLTELHGWWVYSARPSPFHRDDIMGVPW